MEINALKQRSRFRKYEADWQATRRALLSQGDQAVANQAGAAFRADMNLELQAIVSNSSGASAPSTTYAYQWWADTTNGLLKQRNAANTSWMVRGTLAETFVIARSSNTIIGVGDYGRTFSCTSSFTQTFTAAATLSDGFWCEFRNDGSGVITLDPNGAELIDGVATITLQPGESAIINCNGSAFKTLGRLASTYVAAFTKQLFGFTYANNGTDSIDVAAGGAMDATGAYWMAGAALTKNVTVAWAVGNAAGGLDTGAVGNSDYYIWVIARPDTGVVDYLFSLSSTAPTMPTNYTFKRLIGWFKRVAGANVAFHTYETEGGGIEMQWDVPTLDINLSNTLTTSRRTDAVKVPLNFSVIASLNVVIIDGTASSFNWIYCPDQTDAAPSNSAAPLGNGSSIFSTVTFPVMTTMRIRTSAAGLIAARSTLATVDTYLVSTMGFSWARRN